jgi:hypothetical protein
MNGATDQTASARCAPPKLVKQNGPHGVAFIVGALVIACACAMLFFFRPGSYAIYPVCHFYSLTGLHCPGCGSLRALHELLHGNLIEAVRLNALLLLCLTVFVFLVARYVLAAVRRQRAFFTVRAVWLWTFLCAAVAFSVLRNLPGFAWLAP